MFAPGLSRGRGVGFRVGSAPCPVQAEGVIGAEMDQHAIEPVRFQSFQTPLDAESRVLGGKIVIGFTVRKFLAALCDNNELAPSRAEQFTQSLLGDPVSRRCVEEVDAVTLRVIEQPADRFLRWQLEGRIFNLLVAPELDGAESEHADVQARRSQRSLRYFQS